MNEMEASNYNANYFLDIDSDRFVFNNNWIGWNAQICRFWARLHAASVIESGV